MSGFSYSTHEIDAAQAAKGCRELIEYFDPPGTQWPVPKKAFRVENMPRHLVSRLCLFDVLPDEQYRFRVFGTGLVNQYGTDLTGKLLRDAETGEPTDFVHDLYASIVRSGKPLITKTAVTGIFGTFVYDRVICPLADEDGAVKWLLVLLETIDGIPPHKTVLELVSGVGTEIGRG